MTTKTSLHKKIENLFQSTKLKNIPEGIDYKNTNKTLFYFPEQLTFKQFQKKIPKLRFAEDKETEILLIKYISFTSDYISNTKPTNGNEPLIIQLFFEKKILFELNFEEEIVEFSLSKMIIKTQLEVLNPLTFTDVYPRSLNFYGTFDSTNFFQMNFKGFLLECTSN